MNPRIGRSKSSTGSSHPEHSLGWLYCRFTTVPGAARAIATVSQTSSRDHEGVPRIIF
jgi:hypothetical protein